MTGAKGGTAVFLITLLSTQWVWGQDSQQTVEQLRRDMEALQEKVKALENQVSPSTLSPDPAMPVKISLADTTMQATPPDVTVLNTWLKDIKLSGFLDIGYTVNINNPKDPYNAFNNVDRSFDTQSNSFVPNMMELMFERVATADSPAGLRLKIGAGHDAGVLFGTENWGTGAGSNFDIVELYAEYLAPLGKGIDFKVGKFATLAGFEVIESKDNWSYSRSILFTYAIPLTHTGLRATYSFFDLDMAKGVPGIAMTLGVNNGWNVVLDNNTGKTLEWQLSLNPVDWISAAATIYYGDEPNASGAVPTVEFSKRFLFDWVTTVTRGDWKFGVNFDYGSQEHGNATTGNEAEWNGAAAYIRWQMTHWFAPSLRIETLRDEDGFIAGGLGGGAPFFTTGNQGLVTPAQVSIREITWANEMTINPNLTFRIELRHDWSTKYIFQQDKDTVGKKSENTIGFEAIFRF